MHDGSFEASRTESGAWDVLCLSTAGGNPYQRLIYGPGHGDINISYAGRNGLHALQTRAFHAVHLHWDERVFVRTRDAQENRAHVEHSLKILAAFKTRGGRVVWTVHNRTPHKSKDLTTFLEVRQRLCDMADVVHVHADHARDHLVSEYGANPDKIVVVPHPSYLGAYEPEDTTLARSLMPSGSRQFLFMGMFRIAKGIKEIAKAAQILDRRGYDFRVRMHGKAFSGQSEILQRLESNPAVDLRTERVPDEEIAEMFANAHVFLAPYTSFFNSGSVLLALTYGLPVIGANTRELRESVPQACHGLLYDPGEPRGLLRSMIRMCKMGSEELADLRKACRAFAVERHPRTIQQSVARLLRSEPRRTADVAAVTASSFADRISSLRRAILYDAPLSIVDIGANPMNHDAPYKALYDNSDIVLTGFDPQAATIDELRKAGRSRDQYLPYALGDGRSHQLRLYRGTGLTSVLRIRRKTLEFLMGLRKAAREVGTETLQTKRLDDLREVADVDLLKIDIQGAEPMVFRHGQATLAKAVAVHTEVSYFPLYDRQPGFGEVDTLLRKAGFVPHSFYNTVKRHVLSRYLAEVPGLDRTHVLDGDLIYFRDLSDPDGLEDAQICKLALLADGVYGFYDYTLRCIEILEQRGRTDPEAVQSYLAQLRARTRAEA